jgi:hypothetical protein
MVVKPLRHTRRCCEVEKKTKDTNAWKAFRKRRIIADRVH